MKERDLEMKDNDSISTKTINDNSVVKRKQKKLPCCRDSSIGEFFFSVPVTPESQTNTSSKIEPEDEIKPDHSYSKDIGDDGHYYECVICDLLGNLLCCDSCPRTYHIQCLDPPLKRIPTGTWHCPNCLLEPDSLESMNDMDPISTLARTKISVGKSKTGLKLAGLDKKSQISGGSILGKKNECLPVLDAATGKSRKRKKKVHAGESQKKRKTGKDKCTVDTCRERRSKTDSACPGTSKSRRKCKTKTDVGLENEDIQLKDQMVSEEAGHLSDELHADHVLRDFQQVERVLGCRVQRNETNTEGAQNIVSHSEAEKCIMNDIKVDKVYVYRRSVSKTSGEISAAKGKIQGNSSVTTEGLGERIGTMSTGENTDLNLRNLADNEASKNCEIPTKMAGIEMKTNSGSGKTKDPMVAESVSEEKVSYEFLVKWVRKSHIHNSWISESELKVLAKRKLDNYKSKYGTTVINICEEQWKLPQRVIALKSSISGSTEAFVKWTGLPYDECTWERIDKPVIARSSHLIDLFNQFENRALENDASKEDAPRGKGDLVPLVEQPKEMVGGSLFPHQLEALNWLRKCWFKSRNVILADEMGLGKTVSACAFLSSVYFEFKAKLPCLVLVPLSTMPNWMAEFALWAPNLNVVEYHGSAKARASIRQYEWHANKKMSSYKFNVLLTTYEMVLADSTHLRGVPWEVLVVDEGHRLKNASSKLFSLLNSFSFQHRVLLTGTPLQNNIGEMYNLLNFLQPSSFPSLSSFEEKFNDLTTAEKVEELKKLVSPHMLRRLKKDAMQNIPPRMERIVPVELSSIQAEYYRAMLTKNYHILRNIGKGVAQQSMLNIVMQLRKVCNHPYLIQGTEPESGSVEFLHEMRIKASAKLTLLHSMLKVLYKEGHRVLIFSQMTKLLDILEDYLTVEFGPDAYERVDGSVSVADRQTAIARFNQDKTRFIFLLSTRSCGLGINLATADTVIIYDSDFNPHADIQAMSRAHRIGQSSRLFVYRLVVRASVEERILQLAKKKLMLDQLFVSKSGSQKEVEDILRWGTEELFTDENCRNKDEAVGDVEHKHRKRPGGLGDVYGDKCTGGTNKIVWDENAIINLLDRSNLHSGDNTEGNLENDLLGSVKSVDWNDEPTEEEAATESLAVVTYDACAQNSEKQEDNLGGGTEENEWDWLLRVRWEKYQNNEEGALGRGKRQKKPVYRDEYAILPYGILSEDGADKELEPEPKREYTPAGRALKIKFAKLRARQKERLAQINAIKASGPTDQPSGPGSFSQLPLSHDRDGTQMDGLDQLIGENAQKIKSDSKSFRYSSSSDVLPVLALCAPSPHSLEGKGSDHLKNYRSTPSNFQEKMALPNYQFPLTIVPHPQPNLFPSSSLGSRVGDSKYSIQELPALPQLPHSKFAHYQQECEVPPMWGLGRTGPTFSLLPQSHRKVLENIMMRTRSGSGSGSGSNIYHKKKSVKEVWSENELDFLWIGIRRHGRGNWDKMLQDPSLKFSKFRTVEDLSARWEEEQLTLLDEPVLRVQKPSMPKKSINFSQFPNITDGTTARTLHGSRFVGSTKFQPHLTVMKLGFGNGSSTGPSGRPELPSSDVHIEQPLLQKSFGTSNSSSLGFNSSALQQKEEEQRATIKSLDILRSYYNNKGKSISHSKGKEEVGGSNKLPHWLQEAASAPAQTLVPDLPPTISAIARSIHLLHGDKKKPAIPPFTAPGPPPSLPKDPRPSLKKRKQRSHTFHQFVPDTTSKNLQRSLPGNNAPSTSVLLGPQICLAQKPLTASSGLPWIEPDLNMPPLDLYTVNLSSTSVWGSPPGEKLDRSGSGDSSKTQSDPALCNVEEISSEEAVSDHRVSDNEPLP